MANRYRAIIQSVGLSIVFVGAMLAGSGAVAARGRQPAMLTPVPPTGGLRVIRSDEHGLLLELTVPDYALHDGQITISGTTSLAEAGKPELPVFTALIGIPADGSVSVQVAQDESEVVTGAYSIAPAPSPYLPDGDLQPGAVRRIPDRAAYASRALYPAVVARVADTAWLRDQHMARIEIYPFQYRAAAQELTWHRHLLIEVNFDGAMPPRQLAPSSAGPGNNPFDAVLQAQLLNATVARQWRTPLADPSAVARPDRLSSALVPDYKVVVNHDGVYSVTYQELQTAGLNVDTIDPRNLRMTNQGLDVAITVVGEADGHFDPGDYVLFYGQKLRGDLLASKWITESNHWLTYGNWHPQFSAFTVEQYTDNNVYWLSVGAGPGLRMAARTGAPDGTAFIPDYYTATVKAEKATYWNLTTFTGLDPFYWERVNGITSIVTRTYPITLTAVAAQNLSATVTGEVVGAVDDVASPDHWTQFYLNSMTRPFEDTTWEGISRHRFTGAVPQAALREGANNLVFVARFLPARSKADAMLFDWFSIDYARRFQADAGSLIFQGTYTGAVQYDVGKLTSADLVVFDVSNPWQPQQIVSPSVVAGGGGYTASFEVSQTVPLTYVVADRNAWQSPAAITRYAPTVDLRDPGNGADYIIITPRAFITGAQTLADYRATQGLRTRVVDLEDVFNQFTDGLYHPIAIKAFLKYAYYNWQAPAPAYVMLVGDGHWNFKNYSITNYPPVFSPVYMPPFLAWIDPWQGEVDSSSLLAAVAGDDIVPDMAISRVPVNSLAEMNTVVSKTIAYEQAAPQAWQRRLMFVADNTPDPKGAGDFVALSEAAISQYAPKSYAIDRVYENNFGCPFSLPCPAVNNAITSTLNLTGALLVNYVGHGSPSSWSDEQILISGNAPAFSNLDHLPIILSLTCLDGYWILPSATQSLMETLLRASNGGDVASFSPTGLGVTTGHDTLQRGFYEAAFTDGMQHLGSAAMSAKLDLFATGYNLDLVNTFTIFGDPALHMLTYRLSASPARDVQYGRPNVTVSHTLQVTNTGFLTYTGLVKITGNTWPAVAQAASGLPPGQSMPLVVTTTIPGNALSGATDVMTVTFESPDGVQQTQAVTLITVANPYRIALPLVMR